MKLYWQHFWYLIRHKWYVFIDCCRLGIPWRGIVHDLSKFSIIEWKTYVVTQHLRAATFYDPLKVNHGFDIGWLHHIHHNQHHWQYWVLVNHKGQMKILDMPTVFMKEMLADWYGASMTKNGYSDREIWYILNKDKIILHPESRYWIERFLNL